MLPDENGECKERYYEAVMYDVTNEVFYPGDPEYKCESTSHYTAFPAYHLTVPVTNEACLFSLWMCACWASGSDGCLCAQENPTGSVTITKPKEGGCKGFAGPVTDTSAAGDSKGHALLGFGGLALKCSPNPCQACCDNKCSQSRGAGCCGCRCGCKSCA